MQQLFSLAANDPPCHNADMDLKTYFSQSTVTRKELAAMVGISRAFLSEIETGKKAPGRNNARAIEKHTGGMVSRDQWDRDE